MITFSRIRAINFMSWASLDFSFYDKRLALIVGPNGSGKSSIPAAVCFALYGRTQKGLAGDGVIGWGATQAQASLELNADGKEVRIVRDRGTSNDIALTIDGVDQPGTNTEKQNLINGLLKADFKTFTSTAFFGRGVEFLGEITDAERKDLFKRVLDLTRTDRAYEVASKWLNDAQAKLQQSEVDIFTLDHHIELIQQELKHNQDMATNFDTIAQERLDEWIEQYRELEARLADSGTEASKNRLIELDRLIEEDDSQEEFEELLPVYHKAEMITGKLESDLEIAKTKLEQTTELGICPECKRPLADDVLLHEYQENIKVIESKYKMARSKLLKLAEQFTGLKAQVTRHLELTRERDRLADHLNDSEEQIALMSQTLADLQEKMDKAKTVENPYPGMVEVVQNKLDVELSNLKKQKKEHKELERRVELLTQVKEVFSKRGALSFILENYFGYLTEKANYYLGLLGNDIRMDIRATKETKKGDKREEITIEVWKGDRKAAYENLSDGQRQAVNIVLLFAIHSLCRSTSNSDFDILFLDEVLDLSLDAESKEMVVELLRIIQQEGVNSIIVISHAPEIRDQFEQVLEIEIDESGHSRVVS